MGKRGNYINQLLPLLQKGSAFEDLEQMLVANSNLPGPRANLELAWAFADCFEKIQLTEELSHLLTAWANLAPEQAPSGHPLEFLPFCAIQALGAAYLRTTGREHILVVLKKAAGDSRWRVREAVAMGFQRIAEMDFAIAQEVFSAWLSDATLMEKRAILAALAHGPLLKPPERAEFCLDITELVLRNLLRLPRQERKTEGFRILKQGLEYSISLFVESLPEQGFARLEKWVEEDDADLRHIIKSNLLKARLAKKHAAKVQGLLARL